MVCSTDRGKERYSEMKRRLRWRRQRKNAWKIKEENNGTMEQEKPSIIFITFWTKLSGMANIAECIANIKLFTEWSVVKVIQNMYWIGKWVSKLTIKPQTTISFPCVNGFYDVSNAAIVRSDVLQCVNATILICTRCCPCTRCACKNRRQMRESIGMFTYSCVLQCHRSAAYSTYRFIIHCIS